MGQKIIWDFIKNHKWSYLAGVVFMFMASYIQTLFPKVLGNTIDILSEKNFSFASIRLNILYMLLIAAGTFLSIYAWRNLVVANARTLECYIREKLYDHFQKMSPEFYNRRKTGDLIAYAINDISAVRMTFGPATAMAINGLAICGVSIYSMASAVDWKLTVMSLLPVPIVVLLMLKIGKIVRMRFRKVQENFATISDRVQENIYGIRVIKAYVQEEDEVKKFEELNNRMMDSNLSMVKVSSYLSPIIEICFSISFILNLTLGGSMVLSGSISIGDFTAFNGYLVMIMHPIISIGRVINILQRGMASLKRLNDIFEVTPDITDGEKKVSQPVAGRIEVKNLNFSYPGSREKALSNINITVPRGHTLGIVGKTGSGKSTIANLLLKLYNIEKGKVIIDGVDINDYTLAALREGFGYVPQENFLFSASIKNNIRFFKDIYSDEEIENAAQNSCIYESIDSLPNRFDTKLEELGVNLSGGQKQRISIARALIKEPSVLILDDSLSAVDTITESLILENLRNIRENKTTIIIAHRLSAVENADEIVVLDKGTIVEKGTHEGLLKKGGLYYEIYSEQHKDKQAGFEDQAS